MRQMYIGCGIVLLLVAGCMPTSGERNAFWTLTEMFGASSSGDDDSGSSGTGGDEATDVGFRRDMTVTFTNNSGTSNLDVSFAAWVNVSSIRSAEQQDALLRGGYVQLTSELQIGSAFTLVPGTFVYNGPGLAGATAVTLASSGAEEGEEFVGESLEYTLITPDVLLVFSQPPVSCDSVAFTFGTSLVDPGTGPATSFGGQKTLAQVDVYECDPFRPGLFFKSGGGAKAPNEYFEGENVLFEFSEGADADGNYATVTISG